MSIWTKLSDAGVDIDRVTLSDDATYRMFAADDEWVYSFGHATTETGDLCEGWDFHDEIHDSMEWVATLDELIALVVKAQTA